MQELSSKLKALKDEFLMLGEKIEEYLRKILLAQVEGGAPNESLVGADAQFEELIIRIENKCFEIIAVGHLPPVHLRLMGNLIKMLADLEQIVFNAAKIARIVPNSDRTHLDGRGNVRDMSERALRMFRNTLRAFSQEDRELALGVIDEDNQVINAHARCFCELLDSAKGHPAPKDQAAITQLMSITKSIDRIAHHAANIGKRVLAVITDGKEERS